jgi:hypothetical protein
VTGWNFAWTDPGRRQFLARRKNFDLAEQGHAVLVGHQAVGLAEHRQGVLTKWNEDFHARIITARDVTTVIEIWQTRDRKPQRTDAIVKQRRHSPELTASFHCKEIRRE